ncbi:GTP-binding protein Di-Ras2-like [Hydractinia symbiolongicarpus]|uniref:GTP-binding protein Di-Ras2-like n=1 Tax=Hydractinia symbiolongicarpus TaxID=13093 RepID=UPI0025513014|nr:GTP-binding protein Di-Ras2-like [Hydractinia symbiolongicarpus]
MTRGKCCNKKLRVTLMGGTGVGKSVIARRLIGKEEIDVCKPTIFDYYEEIVEIGEASVFLEINDTSGNFCFPAMDKLTMEHTDIIVIVFSLEELGSFEHAMNILCNSCTEQTLPVIFVGNKKDKISNRKLPCEENLENYIMCQLNKSYIEMSALHDDAEKLLRRIYEDYEIAHGPYHVRQKKSIIKNVKSRFARSVQSILHGHTKN